MLPLHLTSCLFGSIVVHAHMASPRTTRLDCYHHLFLAVTVLSILYHSMHNPYIGAIDKIFAHAAFLFVICMDSQRSIEQGNQWLLFFPLAVTCLWSAQSLWPSKACSLHAVLHIVTVIGVNCFIGFLDWSPDIAIAVNSSLGFLYWSPYSIEYQLFAWLPLLISWYSNWVKISGYRHAN